MKYGKPFFTPEEVEHSGIDPEMAETPDETRQGLDEFFKTIEEETDEAPGVASDEVPPPLPKVEKAA